MNNGANAMQWQVLFTVSPLLLSQTVNSKHSESVHKSLFMHRSVPLDASVATIKPTQEGIMQCKKLLVNVGV